MPAVGTAAMLWGLPEVAEREAGLLSISAFCPDSGCMANGGEQSADVDVVESGDGIAKVDGDASGETG